MIETILFIAALCLIVLAWALHELREEADHVEEEMPKDESEDRGPYRRVAHKIKECDRCYGRGKIHMRSRSGLAVIMACRRCAGLGLLFPEEARCETCRSYVAAGVPCRRPAVGRGGEHVIARPQPGDLCRLWEMGE
jgi:hypothetical protein